MDAEALLNAYLDLNLLLILGTSVWLALRWGLARTKLSKAYLPQLRLLNGLTVLLAVSPLFGLAFTTWVIAHPPNISDMLVSQYLQGNVSMSAASFEAALGLRESTVRELLAQKETWAQFAAAAFAFGAVLCALHVVFSVLRLRRTLGRSFAWKRIGRVNLLVSDTCRVAFSTRGLFNRYVVLPASLLQDPRDLRMTVAHELQHFRQRDIECEFLLETLRPVLFWNPAFFLWRREVRILREFACDQALALRKDFDPRAYCECLIRACAAAAQKPALFTRTTPAVALVDRRESKHRSALRDRVIAITAAGPQEVSPSVWLLMSGLLAATVLCFALFIQRPSDWSHDRIMLSTIVNLERMAARNQSSFGSDPAAQQPEK
jgi:beta-lactamase regulating signal transducer with metallopeptidase domain